MNENEFWFRLIETLEGIKKELSSISVEIFNMRTNLDGENDK